MKGQPGALCFFEGKRDRKDITGCCVSTGVGNGMTMKLMIMATHVTINKFHRCCILSPFFMNKPVYVCKKRVCYIKQGNLFGGSACSVVKVKTKRNDDDENDETAVQIKKIVTGELCRSREIQRKHDNGKKG